MSAPRQVDARYAKNCDDERWAASQRRDQKMLATDKWLQVALRAEINRLHVTGGNVLYTMMVEHSQRKRKPAASLDDSDDDDL